MAAITNPFASEWAWLKAHEKIVLILAALLVCGWGYSKYLGFRDAADQRANLIQHAKLQSDADKANAIAVQAQKQADDYKALATQAEAEKQQLLDIIKQRDAAARQQQETDKHLPPDQLAGRIVTLAPGGSIIPQPDATYKVDQPEAEAIVQQLDLIAPLQKDLADETAAESKTEGENRAANDLISTLNLQVSAAQQEFNDTGYVKDKKSGVYECRGGVCKTDIKVAVDAEARKHRKIEVILTILGYALGRKY